ncbi:hypothetical protein [Treponema sp.]|uniref:hypothetical protein n=1 Tax=Treponema sp. TaxID=166 RepID=UPI002579D51A|nr:hypothetical protein [Treponema sp.]MBE6353892.1 hypothetical protein [Treponema sp.]
MKYVKNLILPVFIIVFTLIMLFVFRVIPGGKIWNNYSVLYADTSVTEGEILKVLKEQGCMDVISLSVQFSPLISPVTPVLPPSMNSYLGLRLNYFYDKSGKYRLYYVPEKYKRQLTEALDVISRDLTSESGIDSTGGYPIIVPLACAVLFFFFLYFSENRILFLLSGIMFLIYSAAIPVYSTACSVILFLCIIFISQRLWNRKGSIKKILGDKAIRFLAAAALAVMLLSSIRSALLGACTVLSSLSMIYLYRRFICFRESKLSFTFVPIFSASQLVLFSKKSINRILAAPVIITVIMIFFLTNSSFADVKTSASVELPSPVTDKNEETGELPDAEDYYNWAWNTVSFPYKNLNADVSDKNPEPGDSVSVPAYEKSSSGIIEFSRTVLTYDSDFIRKMAEQIKKSSPLLIENVLIEQKNDFKAGYSRAGHSETENFTWSLILIIISAIVVPVIWLFHFLSGRSK